MACSVCGPDTTHALIRSGTHRWLFFGPPAGEVREYARCLSCGTRRGVADEPASVSWTEAVSWDHPITADPR
jgi:uncharacterized Zn finger protein